jgi:CubicO group peptidase (beta-lactamase class C family)
MLFAILLASAAAASPVGASNDSASKRLQASAPMKPPIDAAVTELRDFLRRIGAVGGSFPSAALVVATADSVPLVEVFGDVKAGFPSLANSRSRFYIASQTKAFIGTMAARLDERGVLPLSTTLDQIWPGMELPEPASARAITLRDLLSHQAPLSTETLNFITANVAAIPARQYPKLLAHETIARESGFGYSNLGYLIYGAALEARTGRSWAQWLDREVLRPLKLRDTATQTNRVPHEQMVWSHEWTVQGWSAFAPKSDSTRHAAGGLVSSARDQAIWIQANLGGAAPSPTEARHFDCSPAPHNCETFRRRACLRRIWAWLVQLPLCGGAAVADDRSVRWDSVDDGSLSAAEGRHRLCCQQRQRN